MTEITVELAEYLAFHKNERPNRRLGYKNPAEVYPTRQGDGASIRDHFSDARGVSPMSLRVMGDTPQGQTGQRCSAAVGEMDCLNPDRFCLDDRVYLT